MQFKVYLEHKCDKSTHLVQCRVQTKRLMSHFLPESRDQVWCTALVTWLAPRPSPRHTGLDVARPSHIQHGLDRALFHSLVSYPGKL